MRDTPSSRRHTRRALARTAAATSAGAAVVALGFSTAGVAGAAGPLPGRAMRLGQANGRTDLAHRARIDGLMATQLVANPLPAAFTERVRQAERMRLERLAR